MRPVSRPISTVKVAVRSDDKARRRRQTILAFAAASAVALCSFGIARADTWVTVGPDGSVTRTITSSPTNPTPAQSQIREDGTYTAVYPPVAPNTNVQIGSGHTTLFSGTHYPVPSYYPNVYPYYNPGGATYPIGPAVPGFSSPTITTLPSTGYAYGPPVYGYPGYPYPAYPYPAYPAPVYSYPYPAYGTSGVYYSGPIGGGGTIYSSSTTTNKGYGIGVGNRGWKVKGGNTTRSSSSTTTVTTGR